MSKSLAMIFKLESGNQRTFTVNLPKEELSEGTVEACMDEMVKNGAMWTDPLVETYKAKLTQKTVTVLLDNS